MMKPDDRHETSPPEENEEFDRFQRLTRDLLKVPKAGLDAERRKREKAGHSPERPA